jgi:hypothetical protein
MHNQTVPGTNIMGTNIYKGSEFGGGGHYNQSHQNSYGPVDAREFERLLAYK